MTRTPEDAMKLDPKMTRWITTGLLAASVLSISSTAFADRGGRRFKGVDRHSDRVIIRERSSSVGPVLAGLVGGFIIGQAVSSNAHPVIVHERRYERRYPRRPVVVYRYHDPYCDEWYDSLDECEFRGHRHPRVIQVIDLRTGRQVRSLHHHDGEWRDFDDDEDCED
jgi:hypothetical protein